MDELAKLENELAKKSEIAAQLLAEFLKDPKMNMSCVKDEVDRVYCHDGQK